MLRANPDLAPATLLGKMTAAFVITLLLVVCSSSLASFAVKSTEIRERLEHHGSTLAQLVASSARTAVFAENSRLLADIIENIMQEEDVVGVSIYSESGKVLLAKDKSATTREKVVVVSRPVLIEISEGAAEGPYFPDRPAGVSKRRIGHVEVRMDKEMIARELKSELIKDLVIAAASLILGVALASYIAKGITRPLSVLTESVRSLGEGRGDIEVPIASDDEVGRLAQAFNRMAHSLKKRDLENRSLEKKLREAEKMEAVATLSSGIAHDFNNIMSTISGALHIMEKKLPHDSPHRREAQRISVAVGRAKTLVRQIHAYSQSGGIEASEVDLSSLLSNLRPMLGNLLSQDCEVIVRLSDEPLPILADTVQIERVVLNLCANARDAMPVGGRIQISAGKCLLEDEKAEREGRSLNGLAILKIEDNGVGIEEQVQTRIFEPFFTTKEVGKGTGLGLSIVYGIIRQHGGQIEMHSQPGVGTAFTIYFPLLKGEKLSEGRFSNQVMT
jgi:signal transduction histidine kinase